MKLASLLAATILTMSATSAANAAVTVNIHGVGSNVVALTSGSLDLTGLTLLSNLYYLQTGVQGSDGYIGTGAGGHQFSTDPFTLQNGYSGLSGPTSFGSGPFTYADTGTGNPFAFNASFFGNPYVFVPTGYVSGTALNATSTFLNQTISSLGLNAGHYVYSSATDSVTINIAAVPEPATWAMMLVGFGVLGASLRYRRRSTKIAYA